MEAQEASNTKMTTETINREAMDVEETREKGDHSTTNSLIEETEGARVESIEAAEITTKTEAMTTEIAQYKTEKELAIAKGLILTRVANRDLSLVAKKLRELLLILKK